MPNQNIIKYLKQNKGKFPKEALILELRKTEYDEMEINEGIGIVYKSGTLFKNKVVWLFSVSGFLVIALVIVLLLQVKKENSNEIIFIDEIQEELIKDRSIDSIYNNQDLEFNDEILDRGSTNEIQEDLKNDKNIEAVFDNKELESNVKVYFPLSIIDLYNSNRGNYVNVRFNNISDILPGMNYKDWTIDLNGLEVGSDVYVILEKNSDIYDISSITVNKPTEKFFIEGKVINAGYDGVDLIGYGVEYGIESFYLPKNQIDNFPGGIINDTILTGEIIVEEKGKAVLKNILINEKIWPDEIQGELKEKIGIINRDEKRRIDLAKLHGAFISYRRVNKHYPDMLSLENKLVPGYIKEFPKDPLDSQLGCLDNQYDSDNEKSSYSPGSFGYKISSFFRNDKEYVLLQACFEDIKKYYIYDYNKNNGVIYDSLVEF